MRSSDPLLAAMALLRPRVPRLLLAMACGAASLGSALALAAVSAWLITRAWQMPPVLDLTVAVVAVRALAITRGVLRYCERLASHDTALRAAGSAREQIYARLAAGPIDAVMRRHSGELVTRLGADVDEVADLLVRAVLPIGVAAVLAVAAVTAIALISPSAAVALAVSLSIAGVLAPWLAARAVRAQEAVAAQYRSLRNVAAMSALDHGPELRVAGQLDDVITESIRRQRDWGDAIDRAAAPAAVASATPIAATGISVLGAVAAGIGLAGAVAPTTLAVLMLLPLSTFEAATALPPASVALTRARLAARRLIDLANPSTPSAAPPTAGRPLSGTLELAAVDLRSGFEPPNCAGPFSVTLPPGARAIITGASGSGKTALLMTLAGLLAPCEGAVTLDGRDVRTINEPDLRAAVRFFAEDAHVFATTVRDNLLVSRGDCADEELRDALRRVGLQAWIDGLPDALDTVLTGGAHAISAGQRRRLLLARALLSPAGIVLLDEPTEHLDADAGPILQALLDPACELFSRDRTVVVATHQMPSADTKIDICLVNKESRVQLWPADVIDNACNPEICQ